MIPYCYDATAQAEAREAAADRDAIKCDCCGGLIRVGEVKFSLGMGQTVLTICNDCKGDLVSSAEIPGVEDEIYL